MTKPSLDHNQLHQLHQHQMRATRTTIKPSRRCYPTAPSSPAHRLLPFDLPALEPSAFHPPAFHPPAHRPPCWIVATVTRQQRGRIQHAPLASGSRCNRENGGERKQGVCMIPGSPGSLTEALELAAFGRSDATAAIDTSVHQRAAAPSHPRPIPGCLLLI